MRQLLPILLLLLLTIGCARGHTRPARDFVTVDAPVVALTNVRLIDGTGQPGRANQTVIIRDGRAHNAFEASLYFGTGGAEVAREGSSRSWVGARERSATWALSVGNGGQRRYGGSARTAPRHPQADAV